MLIKPYVSSSLKYCKNNISKERAFTLIEVLVTIVVIGIAATSIMSVFISTVKTSADPLIQQQAVSIAEAYMEEIQSQHFADPVAVETGGAEAGEARATYNDIQDYNGLSDAGAKDQNDVAIVGLTDYDITVTVTAQSLSGTTTIAAADSRRIDITVTHTVIDPIVLSGFRTNH
ncbi:MAG: type II secretion system protein [Gammaproteobacteria bacterium]|jgi:MSHA pilin protein MshD|nr:type II secretion system protein [Gammaproteobacteria bacterium]MBT4077393.1 type II secretion system protein [Gammaproteobacteria bacterium]MBT4194265.1 type II secretion system protein [Gammaproteobacteria bacterium]MBT4451635.1 type II secretion system protein [Gammaproteobacteria bacterium]MBT6456682.1 type II secretion system protein [Gammaproteobacteria bacterium]